MKTKQQIVDTNRHKLRKKPTFSENRFKSILEKTETIFTFQKGFFKFDVAYIVDFYLPKFKTVIEIDGEYHFEEKQESYDLYREKYLIQKRNFALIRISNNYLKLKTDQEMITILNETLKRIKRSDKIVFY